MKGSFGSGPAGAGTHGDWSADGDVGARRAKRSEQKMRRAEP